MLLSKNGVRSRASEFAENLTDLDLSPQETGLEFLPRDAPLELNTSLVCPTSKKSNE